MAKNLRFAILVALLLSLFSVFANAQSRFDGYFGIGTATVGSSNDRIDFLESGFPLSTPSMDGVFGTFGGALMLKPSLGFGGQVSFRFAQGDYAGLGYRPIFYDFNGIFTPDLGDRIMPEFQAGLGGVNMRFYDATSPYYDYNTGQYSTFAGSTNHFQLHAAAGLRIFVTDRVFVRPTLDYRWVKDFHWFGSNSVPEYSIAIGFTSGR